MEGVHKVLGGRPPRATDHLRFLQSRNFKPNKTKQCSNLQRKLLPQTNNLLDISGPNSSTPSIIGKSKLKTPNERAAGLRARLSGNAPTGTGRSRVTLSSDPIFTATLHAAVRSAMNEDRCVYDEQYSAAFLEASSGVIIIIGSGETATAGDQIVRCTN